MKELNTKVGVFLTTYTQEEIDKKIEEFMALNESDGCIIFLDEVKSFNSESEYYITHEEAIELTGLEKKATDIIGELYTNYKGNPLGLPDINGVEFFYTDPIDSLKSAFYIAAPEFNFDKDFFHPKIVK